MQNAAAHLQKSLFVPCNEGEGKQILSQLLWTGATHATPPLSQSPGGWFLALMSQGSIPVWRWFLYALTGSSGTVQWVPTPARCRWQPSRYQHTPLGTISSPLESPQHWGLHSPRQAATLKLGLAPGGFGAEWHIMKLCISKDSPAPC